jgi:hypothetical protein
MTSSHYLRASAALAFAVFTFWLASRQLFFDQALSSAFFAVALFSIFPIMLRTHLSIWEVATVFVLTAALWGMDIRFLGYRSILSAGVSFLGLASLFILVSRVFRWEGQQRRFAIFTLVPSFLFVASGGCSTYFLDWTGKAHPKVLDLYLFAFDATLHVQLSFLLAQLLTHSVAVTLISFFVYLALPIAIGMTYAGCLMRDRENAWPAFLAMLITGPVGVIFYNLFPAVGPVHIFGDRFPWHPLTYEQAKRLFLEPVAVVGLRNSIPSLHATWIYLVCWYARRLSLIEKLVAAFFLVFTLCYTLGSGEHYFIDLVVAVPFTVFIISMAELLVGRAWRCLRVPLLYGLATTIIWFAGLRFAIPAFRVSPLLPWTACALTLVTSYCAARKLSVLHQQSTDSASLAAFAQPTVSQSVGR